MLTQKDPPFSQQTSPQACLHERLLLVGLLHVHDSTADLQRTLNVINHAQILQIITIGINHLGTKGPQSYHEDTLQEDNHTIENVQSNVCDCEGGGRYYENL